MTTSTLPPRRPSHTKIVATIGPACAQVEQLAELIQAGVDVFRVNMAHGSRAEHQQRLADVRQASDDVQRPVAILIDLAGPKIRLGDLPEGQHECVGGDKVTFVRGDVATRPGEFTVTYEPLIDELHAGDCVVLADGTVSLRVDRVDGDSAVCHVVQGGIVRSRQGVNLPGVVLSVPTLGEVDRDNAVWAAQNDVDFVGLSFVRSPDDVRQLKSLLAKHGSDAQVVAKIEKPEAVAQLDAIVEATDAVMVARGDLGVEIDVAEVPIVQKRIINRCRRRRKPVIVATQMLDSMQHARIPTRAEVNDVANAILDGADACMLSGETAIGVYPREAVEMMHRVATATESLHRRRRAAEPEGPLLHPITEATAEAAGALAERLQAKILVIATGSGQTALTLSKNRYFVPTIGVSDERATLRRMCLYWGVVPLAGAPTDDPRRLMEFVVHRGKAAGHLAAGDRAVMMAGTGLQATKHNMIVVHQID